MTTEREGPGRYFREKRSSTLKAASLLYQAEGPLDFFFRWGAITANTSDGGGDENDGDNDDGGWWKAGGKGDVGGRVRLVLTYLMAAQHGSLCDRGPKCKRSSAFIISPRKRLPVSKARSIPSLIKIQRRSSPYLRLKKLPSDRRYSSSRQNTPAHRTREKTRRAKERRGNGKNRSKGRTESG